MRQLTAFKLSSPEYPSCITRLTDLKAFLKSELDFTLNKPDEDLQVHFVNGNYNITVDCVNGTGIYNLTCAENATLTDSAPKGNYTKIGFTTSNSTNTYTPSRDTASLCYDVACPGTPEAATPSIDFNDDTKKSFTVVLASAYEGETAPKVYAGQTEITCTGNDKKDTLTCTPTKEQVKNGKHDIYLGTCKLYTGITITVTNNSDTPSPSSGELVTFSKLLVFVLGLMLF